MLYLLKKYPTEWAIAKHCETILRYVRTSNMTLQQYVDDLISNFCQVADVYDESILNDLSIGGVVFSHYART